MSSPISFAARFAGLVLLTLALCPLYCLGKDCPAPGTPAPPGTVIAWTIHVNVALDSDNKIKYAACPSPTPTYPLPVGSTACPEYVENDKRTVHLCQNDTVVWYVHTKKDKDGVATMVQPEGVLGAPVFVAPEASYSATGTVSVNTNYYEYYVGAFDSDANKPYTDDPKMVVGGSNPQLIDELLKSLDRAEFLAGSLPESDSATKLKDDIDKAKALLLKRKSDKPK